MKESEITHTHSHTHAQNNSPNIQGYKDPNHCAIMHVSFNATRTSLPFVDFITIFFSRMYVVFAWTTSTDCCTIIMNQPTQTHTHTTNERTNERILFYVRANLFLSHRHIDTLSNTWLQQASSN